MLRRSTQTLRQARLQLLLQCLLFPERRLFPKFVVSCRRFDWRVVERMAREGRVVRSDDVGESDHAAIDVVLQCVISLLRFEGEAIRCLLFEMRSVAVADRERAEGRIEGEERVAEIWFVYPVVGQFVQFLVVLQFVDVVLVPFPFC